MGGFQGLRARTVAKTLTKQEAKIRQKTGAPDLNTLFILNMPPRAMSKMTQGMVDSAMVDAIVNIANGHTFRGLGGVIGRLLPQPIRKQAHCKGAEQ